MDDFNSDIFGRILEAHIDDFDYYEQFESFRSLPEDEKKNVILTPNEDFSLFQKILTDWELVKEFSSDESKLRDLYHNRISQYKNLFSMADRNPILDGIVKSYAQNEGLEKVLREFGFSTELIESDIDIKEFRTQVYEGLDDYQTSSNSGVIADLFSNRSIFCLVGDEKQGTKLYVPGFENYYFSKKTNLTDDDSFSRLMNEGIFQNTFQSIFAQYENKFGGFTTSFISVRSVLEDDLDLVKCRFLEEDYGFCLWDKEFNNRSVILERTKDVITDYVFGKTDNIHGF